MNNVLGRGEGPDPPGGEETSGNFGKVTGSLLPPMPTIVCHRKWQGPCKSKKQTEKLKKSFSIFFFRLNPKKGGINTS